jgi:hypothetical protein
MPALQEKEQPLVRFKVIGMLVKFSPQQASTTTVFQPNSVIQPQEKSVTSMVLGADAFTKSTTPLNTQSLASGGMIAGLWKIILENIKHTFSLLG